MKKMSAVLCILMGSIFGWAITINTTSPNLGITFMSANEAQPHLTFNELVSKLDGLVMPVVKIYPADPDPVANAPEEGDMFIVPVGSTGDWDGEDNNLALYINEAWAFFTPQDGWQVKLAASSGVYSYVDQVVFDGEDWSIYGDSTSQFQAIIPSTGWGDAITVRAAGFKDVLLYSSASDVPLQYIGDHDLTAITYTMYVDTDGNPQVRWSDAAGTAYIDFDLNKTASEPNVRIQNTYFSSSDMPDPTITVTDGFILYMDSTTGDLKAKINHGGITKTATLVDFSAL